MKCQPKYKPYSYNEPGWVFHDYCKDWEKEWETSTQNEKVVTETEIKYDFNYAFSYNINKNRNLGAEFINKNVNSKADKFTHSAIFAGPTISYFTNNFWLNLTAMPQLKGLNNPENMNGLNIDEFTKFETRLIFSFSF